MGFLDSLKKLFGGEEEETQEQMPGEGNDMPSQAPAEPATPEAPQEPVAPEAPAEPATPEAPQEPVAPEGESSEEPKQESGF